MSPAEREQERQRNRDLMPEVARIVAQLRDEFGEDQVRVMWARENGHEVGKREE